METLVILILSFIIICLLIVIAKLISDIEKVKNENNDLKNFNLIELSKILNKKGKAIVRKKDCSIVPFNSHVSFDRDLCEFIIVIDLIEDDK